MSLAVESVGSATMTALVIDTEPLFAEGIRDQLSASRTLRYQGRVGKVREVLPTCARLVPDLVFLAAEMDKAGYLTATLKNAHRPRILVVLVPETRSSGEYVERVLGAGADLVLPRAVTGTELLSGIDRVRRRSPFVHPALAGPQRQSVEPADTVQFSLTQRQFEVLCLMADGKRNEVIAEELFVAPETVRTHVKGIRQALKASSRAHAVSRAFELGLLPVEPLLD